MAGIRWIAAAAALAALAGCQQTARGPGPETVVICDSTGCREQARGVRTHDPAEAVPPADPDGVLPVLEARAETDPRAAFDLGMRYMRGDGIRRDPWQALQWMRDAGERGELKAQAALGRLYLTGLEEMGADYNEAVRWLSMAADRGHGESAALLAEAEAARAEEQAYQTALRRWRQVHTRPYWYRTRYYHVWR